MFLGMSSLKNSSRLTRYDSLLQKPVFGSYPEYHTVLWLCVCVCLLLKFPPFSSMFLIHRFEGFILDFFSFKLPLCLPPSVPNLLEQFSQIAHIPQLNRSAVSYFEEYHLGLSSAFFISLVYTGIFSNGT